MPRTRGRDTWTGPRPRWTNRPARSTWWCASPTRSRAVGRSPPEGDGAEAEDGPGGPPLLVGQFVEVRIAGAAPERYFTVPRSALRTGNEIWALRQDTLVTIVPVGVLQRADELVYVTGGLAEGQAVVLSGLQFATEGMVVRTSADGPG